MEKASKLNRWQLLIIGLVSLGLTYVLVSRALDTGSWWQYLGALVFMIVSIKSLVRAAKARK